MRKNKGLLELIAATILASAVGANADKLKLLPTSTGVHLNTMLIEQKSGSTENYGANEDTSFNPPMPPAINLYSIVDDHQLEWDSRPYGSFSDVNVNVVGNTLSSNLLLNLKPTLATNDNAFANKNIYGDLYSVVGDVRSNIIQTYDLKAMAASGATIPLTVTNGHCYDLDVRFTPIPANPAQITSARRDGTNFVIDALVSPGYDHVLLENTNFASGNGNWYPVQTNSLGFPNGTNMTGISYSVPMVDGKDKAIYKIKSQQR